MKTTIYNTIFILIGIYTVSLSTAIAQLPSAEAQVVAKSIEQHHEFRIQTQIGLGLQGFFPSTEYKLVDEIGLEYDVMSLLGKPGVVREVGIGKDLYSELHILAHEVNEDLNKRFIKVVTEEGRAEVETTFRDFQDQLYSMMDDEQIERLQAARDRIGIESYGLKEYLGSSRVRETIGLTEEQVRSVTNLGDESKAELLESIKSLTKQANEAFLAQLDDQQMAKFDQLLDSESKATLMETSLVNPKTSLEGKPKRNYATLIGLTRSASVRDQIEMDQDQYETIKLVKRHARRTQESAIKASVEESLRPEQISQLTQLTVENQAKKFGTVNAVCFGILADEFGFEEDKATELFEIGSEMNSELNEDIQAAKADFLRESLGSLDDDQVEKIIRIARQVDFLKSTK